VSPTRAATQALRSNKAGALAAERARLAAKARNQGSSGTKTAVGGLSVHGVNTTGLGATSRTDRQDSLHGSSPALRTTLGAPMAPSRDVAAGRAAAAVTARLAHIDALLAKSKAAAGGMSGYGNVWPAPLGQVPPPAAAAPTTTAAAAAAAAAAVAASAMPWLDCVAALHDTEVECAMEAAQWALSHWEAPFGAVSAIATPEPTDEGDEAAMRKSARLSALVLAARLRMEREETEALGGLAQKLVDDALACVYALLDNDSGDEDEEMQLSSLLHLLVEDAIAHVVADLNLGEEEPVIPAEELPQEAKARSSVPCSQACSNDDATTPES